MSGAIEREVKLVAPPTFRLPDLTVAANGSPAVMLAPQRLQATYYDTVDLRLIRWGVTVRYRTGEDGGPVWTVKVPAAAKGEGLSRRELNFKGRPNAIPDEVTALLRGFVRHAVIAPVAKLATRRHRAQVRDGDGRALLEVADDVVSVLDNRQVAARFREVEVEVGERAPDGLLDRVVAALRQAGAGTPDPTPKVVRALGSRALAAPEIVAADLGDDPTVAALVRETVAASVVRILRHDAGVRIGDDPEDVHQARVGTRRLRSDLRTFAPLLDDDWLTPLREELGWLAGSLGGVRDADVLVDRLRAHAATLPEPDTAGLAPIFRQLVKQREDARSSLLEAMSGSRYVALLDSLVAAAQSPPPRRRADQPARKVVPDLVAAPWKCLRKAVRDLPADPPPEDLHRIRILAKRARYAADAAVPVAGRRAAAFASALADMQGVLGDHHDAVIAESWLRSAVEEAGPAAALAAGELIALQWAEASSCRKSWPKAWARASDKKLRSWL